jgi:ubiquinone/menaquinone biosynthesis C-methylase UbiE
MVRDRHRAAWEDWGRVDPFWAVLGQADTRHGRWDVDRFFATGVDMVATMLTHAQYYGRPARRGTALDFGCGLGRLTRALAPQFERTHGLDIASTMIEEARRLDRERGRSGAEFLLHDRENLSRYASGSIDFLSCLLVLQHLPSRKLIEGYLREFVRVLSPGGIAVVQLPVHVPAAELAPYPARGEPWSLLRRRLKLLTRATALLRAVGVSPSFLYERLRWEPEMLMTAVPYGETVAIFASAGGQLLDSPPEETLPGGVVNRVYFVAPGDGASPVSGSAR